MPFFPVPFFPVPFFPVPFFQAITLNMASKTPNPTTHAKNPKKSHIVDSDSELSMDNEPLAAPTDDRPPLKGPIRVATLPRATLCHVLLFT